MQPPIVGKYCTFHYLFITFNCNAHKVHPTKASYNFFKKVKTPHIHTTSHSSEVRISSPLTSSYGYLLLSSSFLFLCTFPFPSVICFGSSIFSNKTKYHAFSLRIFDFKLFCGTSNPMLMGLWVLVVRN